MDRHSKALLPSASMCSDSNVDPRIRDLRAALDALDNTRSYEEICLFNKARLEDPSISAGEQLERYAKAKAELGQQSVDEKLAKVDNEQDTMQSQRSSQMKDIVDGKSYRGWQSQTRDRDTRFEHGGEESESPDATVERDGVDASQEAEKKYQGSGPSTSVTEQARIITTEKERYAAITRQ